MRRWSSSVDSFAIAPDLPGDATQVLRGEFEVGVGGQVVRLHAHRPAGPNGDDVLAAVGQAGELLDGAGLAVGGVARREPVFVLRIAFRVHPQNRVQFGALLLHEDVEDDAVREGDHHLVVVGDLDGEPAAIVLLPVLHVVAPGTHLGIGVVEVALVLGGRVTNGEPDGGAGVGVALVHAGLGHRPGHGEAADGGLVEHVLGALPRHRQQHGEGGALHRRLLRVVDRADPHRLERGVLRHHPRLVEQPQLQQPEDEENEERHDDGRLDRRLT